MCIRLSCRSTRARRSCSAMRSTQSPHSPLPSYAEKARSPERRRRFFAWRKGHCAPTALSYKTRPLRTIRPPSGATHAGDHAQRHGFTRTGCSQQSNRARAGCRGLPCKVKFSSALFDLHLKRRGRRGLVHPAWGSRVRHRNRCRTRRIPPVRRLSLRALPVQPAE